MGIMFHSCFLLLQKLHLLYTRAYLIKYSNKNTQIKKKRIKMWVVFGLFKADWPTMKSRVLVTLQ